MTEAGMALSCGLDPADRVDASVGWPLPSVEARLWIPREGKLLNLDRNGTKLGREREGEIQLRGPTIFREIFQERKSY